MRPPNLKHRRPPRPRARLAVERLEDRTVPASYTAANAADLIADINAANLTPEPDTITLIRGASFWLTDVAAVREVAVGLPIIAAGEDLTILGNGCTVERRNPVNNRPFGLFAVDAGATLTLKEMTLQGGLAYGYESSARGGAVYNLGTLILDGVTVQNNTAKGLDNFYTVPAAGGGVYSTGNLTMVGCTVRNNAAIGGRGYAAQNYYGFVTNGYPGGGAFGGGVYVGGGTAAIAGCTLLGNTAQGGNGGDGYSRAPGTAGGNGGDGFGGGLYVTAGTVSVHSSSVTKNTATGGDGGRGFLGKPDGTDGRGIGGGIVIDATAWVGLDAYTAGHVRGNRAATSNRNIAGSYDLIS